ncbi:MAG: rod shape-determining protein MreC [Spirochaetaceae bacterium]|jgi:rod shape-determining protein MreC|nr:rod shape-determining protein MreC [Spirochaetaceae bacterium]
METKRRTRIQVSFSFFLFIFLMLLSGTVLALSTGGFVVDFKQVGFSIFSGLQEGASSITNSASNLANAVRDLARLKQEYDTLTARLQDYEYLQRNNAEIRLENERLKEQLGFSSDFEYTNYPAMIIARNPDTLYSAITINKGSRDGIKKNMPVIAVQNGVVGLVGKIVTVGRGASMIMPVYDYQCNISARIKSTRDIGLVSGMGYDTLLSMKYIKKRVFNELQYGDIVVTSGENDNYLRDIPIGSISKITVVDYDSSLIIELAPVIDFSRLEFVLAVDIKSPVEGEEE